MRSLQKYSVKNTTQNIPNKPGKGEMNEDLKEIGVEELNKNVKIINQIVKDSKQIIEGPKD